MMTVSLAFITIFILIIIELIFFKIATYYNITDHPNARSSHIDVTIRGGGIIFPLSFVLYCLYFGANYTFFLWGLFLISFISFADDIRPVNNKLRLFIHLVAVSLLFYQVDLSSLPWYFILFAFFFTIGTINAINFMDGINGITGGYALITLVSLYLINTFIVQFSDDNLLIMSIFAVIVFNFFNFRKKARCFAGDVGSISVGFIIVYFILSLIIKTQNFNYVLLLLVYGLDTVSTIGFRIIRKEKIMEPHRSHFYQFLSNEKGWPQLNVALLYIIAQTIINLLLVFSNVQSIWVMLCVIFVLGIVFVKMRFVLEGTEKLLKKALDFMI